jgi:hypothetical protein
LRRGYSEALGPGIDATVAAAFGLRAASGTPTAVSALAAEIPPEHQGRHLSRALLTAMKELAREAGLRHLIAPVRPNLKDRYPAIPIERYGRWTRDDGLALRPAGAGSHPQQRDYVFPAGLATVRIDRDTGMGENWGPSIWISHQVQGQHGRGYSDAGRRPAPRVPSSVRAMTPTAKTADAHSAPPRSPDGRPGQIQGVPQPSASPPSMTSR